MPKPKVLVLGRDCSGYNLEAFQALARQYWAALAPLERWDDYADDNTFDLVVVTTDDGEIIHKVPSLLRGKAIVFYDDSPDPDVWIKMTNVLAAGFSDFKERPTAPEQLVQIVEKALAEASQPPVPKMGRQMVVNP